MGNPNGDTVLLVNARSRRGKQWFGEAESELERLGVGLRYSHGFRSIRELIGMSQEAIRDGIPKVIIGGGDGTFSAVTRLFVNKKTIMGVLPLGTGNAFARDLGIPPVVSEACRIIADGFTRPIDVGSIDDDYFVNVATIGLTTKIAQSLTNDRKKRYGRMVYLFAMLSAMRTVKPFRVKIDTENGQDEFETLQVVIGNGRFHAGPFLLSSGATITDGKLSLYALRTTSKSAFVKLATRLPSGTQGELAEVHAEETIGGRIETFPEVPVTVDGEVCVRTPIQFGVVQGGIRVIVPTT